jgi:tryptophan synthase alpha chain
MNRLDRTLAPCREGRKALAAFLTAGYPDRRSTAPLAEAIAAAGADIIELGIPFSDPPADGPTIQACSAAALSGGTTTGVVLGMAREIRTGSDVPLVLMGYLNPILAYGADRFLDEAADAGVDGLIVPDLPMEEGVEFRSSALKRGLSVVLFVSPTTPPARMREIDSASTGFVYGVSVAGVTGARTGFAQDTFEFLSRARREVRTNPLLAGFGISRPVDAGKISRLCDGVIVGSALLESIAGGVGAASGFIRAMREELDRQVHSLIDS